MIDTLITSKTRINLIAWLFLNASTNAYLRVLECEFGDSGKAINPELKRFEKAGLDHIIQMIVEKRSEINRVYPVGY